MRIRRTKLLDRTVNVRDATLCVIATEGEHTEKQYFAVFSNRRVRVWTLPTGEDHQSAPHHVLSRLDKFKQEHDLNEEDTLWLMVDVDHRRAGELDPICREAVQKGFGLAISNPCFELWLLLHFAEADASDMRCGAVETRLRTVLGSYNKTNLNMELYHPQMAEAIQRARALDTNPQARWPDFPGTHVYKVVEMLYTSAEESF